MLFNSLWSVRLQKRKPNYFKLQNEILQKLHLCFKGSKCWSHDDSNYFTIDYGALQTIILNTFCKKKKKRMWKSSLASCLAATVCLMQHTQNVCPQKFRHEEGWRKLSCLKSCMAWLSLQQVFTSVQIRWNVCKISTVSYEVGSIHEHSTVYGTEKETLLVLAILPT